jgi:uncharacterized membrane protein (DUF441 family)
MADTMIHNHTSTMPPTGWLVLGGLAVGTLDLAFAWTFWQSRGVGLPQILQSIASGVLGRASFEGGSVTALLGAGLHYFIATMFVVVYRLASSRYPTLHGHPVACGLPYGVLLYLAMNFVVLPLSAAGMPTFDNAPWVATSVLMHAVFGVMCALFARRAKRDAIAPSME